MLIKKKYYIKFIEENNKDKNEVTVEGFRKNIHN